MKVLVTGGSGFVGSHVVDNLISKGHSPTIFDRHDPKKHHKKIPFYLGDVKDRDAVLDAVSQHDAVINLAGLLGTSESIANPVPSVEVNIVGALNVLEACKAFEKRGMQIGVGNYFMNNPYSITKSTAVRFAKMYNKEHGTEVSLVRGLNAYGERQKHRPVRKVTPNFVIPALLDKPLTVYGDGTQIMDFIYVKDLAEIIVRSITVDHGEYQHVFEAGMGKDTTINDFAKLILELSDSASELNYVPMRPGEKKKSVVKADPGTLSPLGIKESDLTSLREGLKNTIDWYRERLEEFPWDE